MLAGVQFPSDYYAGVDLGKEVAERVIAQAKADGSDAVWTGTVPTGPCYWNGHESRQRAAATGTPLLLSSPEPVPAAGSSGLRFGAGPGGNADCPEHPARPDGVRDQLQGLLLAEPGGTELLAFRYLDKWMFEDRLDKNPPRAARAYALADGGAVRRLHRQPGREVRLLVHPALSARSRDRAAVPGSQLSRAIRRTTRRSRRRGGDARVSLPVARRLRTGDRERRRRLADLGRIHYPMDNAAGVALGKSVAGVFIDLARRWLAITSVPVRSSSPHRGGIAVQLFAISYQLNVFHV